jgi:hypothetical protein
MAHEDERSLVPRNSDIERLAPGAIIEASGFTSMLPIHLRRLNQVLSVAAPPKVLDAFEITLFPHPDYPNVNTNVHFEPAFRLDVKSYPMRKQASVDLVLAGGQSKDLAMLSTRSGLNGLFFPFRDIQAVVAQMAYGRDIRLVGVPDNYDVEEFKKRKRTPPILDEGLSYITEERIQEITRFTLGEAASLADHYFESINKDGLIDATDNIPEWPDYIPHAYSVFFGELMLRAAGQHEPLFLFSGQGFKSEGEIGLRFKEFHLRGTPREAEMAIVKLADLFEKSPAYQDNLQATAEAEEETTG